MRTLATLRRSVLAPLTLLLVLAGCGGSEPASGASDTAGSHEIIVSAASSLTAAFTEIGHAFEAQNPGTTVTFNFGPSDGLATQINDGAPVDVFASASPTWMDSVQNDGPGVSGREDFARNKLAILVPKDNPAGIQTVADLAKPGVKLVLAAEGVPAGDYAREIFDNAGVSDAALANVVSNEEDVKGVVTKLISGDADAGIGYVTDVTSDVADQIMLIPIPEDINVIATYPIAVVSGSQEADLAQSFDNYVLGNEGQQTLAGYGFLPAT
jgi:molybdate transport system substrate-binding protein